VDSSCHPDMDSSCQEARSQLGLWFTSVLGRAQGGLKSRWFHRLLPLVAPLSFMYSSWDEVSTDWGYQLQPSRPIFDVPSRPEEQHFLSKFFWQDKIWFTLNRRTLAQSTNADIRERWPRCRCLQVGVPGSLQQKVASDQDC
jgi:hypothetical protein